MFLKCSLHQTWWSVSLPWLCHHFLARLDVRQYVKGWGVYEVTFFFRAAIWPFCQKWFGYSDIWTFLSFCPFQNCLWPYLTFFVILTWQACFFLLSVVGLCDEAWMTEKGLDKVIHAQRERKKNRKTKRKRLRYTVL